LNGLESQNTGINTKTEERKKKKSTLRDSAEAILVALLIALFIRTFVVQAFKIPSGSMIPTLDIGDHILVNKFSYGLNIFRESYFGISFPSGDINIVSYSKPERGDIIVFKFPKDEKRDFIKRAIGIEGDTVEIKDKIVYINGIPQAEPYTINKDARIETREISPRDNYGPVTVPEGQLLVMGDNRDGSHDSRFWGFVDTKKVKGKAFIIYWSWNSDDNWVRLKRIGKLIH
jgi:signal peptidase I